MGRDLKQLRDEGDRILRDIDRASIKERVDRLIESAAPGMQGTFANDDAWHAEVLGIELEQYKALEWNLRCHDDSCSCNDRDDEWYMQVDMMCFGVLEHDTCPTSLIEHTPDAPKAVVARFVRHNTAARHNVEASRYQAEVLYGDD